MKANPYHELTRKLYEQHKDLGALTLTSIYEKYACELNLYSPTLYQEAVRLGEKLKLSNKLSYTIKEAVLRMKKWPVVYNFVVCKQIPTIKLATIIENKLFRPFAKELMEIIFDLENDSQCYSCGE